MKDILLIWFLTAFTGALLTGIWHSKRIDIAKAQTEHLLLWLLFPFYVLFFLLSILYTKKYNNTMTCIFTNYIGFIFYANYINSKSAVAKNEKEINFDAKQSYMFFLAHKGELFIVNKNLVRLVDVVCEIGDVTAVENYIFLLPNGTKISLPTDILCISLKDKLNESDYTTLDHTFINEK
jgi:hypothetical protein